MTTSLTNGKRYIGAEKEYKSEYFGSGKLIREAIEKFGKWNFKKEILIDGKYIDNWEECLELESACILSLNTLKPYGFNIKAWNWPPSNEACRKGGKTGKKNLEKWRKENPKELLEHQRKVGRQNVELKVGLFDLANKEKIRENGSKGGKNKAYTLFYIDGVLQQTTLGAIFRT